MRPNFTVLTVSRRKHWYWTARANIAFQTIKPEGWVVIQEGRNAPKKTRQSNLNASLNAGLRKITTDYIIFYQDFIDLQPDCFEKLLSLATANTFVTTATINADGNKDGRYLGLDCPRPCRPEEWEANVAIAPMAVIRELGGFDEEYDDGWSWDNVNLAERAEILGCNFILDETNNPRLLPHDRSEIKELNGEFHAQRMREIRAGDRPLRLNYLN